MGDTLSAAIGTPQADATRAGGRQEFAALDSWRGICALLIVFFHFEVGRTIGDQPFHRNLWMFVDFFFVLSGFVIQHSYGERLGSATTRIAFLIKRIGRIWPLHICVLLALLLLELAKGAVMAQGVATETGIFTGRWSIEGLFASIFLVNSWGLFSYTQWNSPSWSVSTEFAAYLIFAACSAAGARMQAWLWAAIVLASVVLLAASGDYLLTSAKLGVLRCLFGFGLGSLAYRLFRRMPAAPIGSGAAATMMEAAVVGAIVLFELALSDLRYSLAAPLLFALTVLVFACEGGAISRLLRTRIPAMLGTLSYSIYMIHDPLLYLLYRVCRFLEPRLGHSIYPEIAADRHVFDIGGGLPMTIAIYALYIAIVITLSAVTFRIIEAPTRGWFRDLAKRYQANAGARRSRIASSVAGVSDVQQSG